MHYDPLTSVLTIIMHRIMTSQVMTWWALNLYHNYNMLMSFGYWKNAWKIAKPPLCKFILLICVVKYALIIFSHNFIKTDLQIIAMHTVSPGTKVNSMFLIPPPPHPKLSHNVMNDESHNFTRYLLQKSKSYSCFFIASTRSKLWGSQRLVHVPVSVPNTYS